MKGTQKVMFTVLHRHRYPDLWLSGVTNNSPIKITRRQIIESSIQFQNVFGKLLIDNFICAVLGRLESVHAIMLLPLNYLVSIFRNSR